MPVPLRERPMTTDPDAPDVSAACPGCPDPDNAARTDRPCQGPRTLESPETDTARAESLAPSVGTTACGSCSYLVCPRTGGYTLA